MKHNFSITTLLLIISGVIFVKAVSTKQPLQNNTKKEENHAASDLPVYKGMFMENYLYLY